MKTFAFLIAAAMALPTAGLAQTYRDAMRDYVVSTIAPWASDPVLVTMVKAQNMRHAGLTQAEIDEMDTSWREQAAAGSGSVISPVMNNGASDFLRSQMAASGGLITELFATDNRGLNVASSAVTSDYWQGDEAKFTKVYGHGRDAVHIAEIEFDESSQQFQGQVSIPVIDNGQVVGTLTVGLRGEPFM